MSNAGRKPYDAILKFKVLVLQSPYDLSDEQTVLMIRDRLSFMRFLDLGLLAAQQNVYIRSASRPLARWDCPSPAGTHFSPPRACQGIS